MKKLFIFAAVLVFAAVSCNKESSPSTDAETYVFTLKASVDKDLTKTHYESNETDFKWDSGDEISVLFHNAGEDHKFFTLRTTGSGEEVTFSGTIDAGYVVGASETEGSAKWALYPAGAHSWDKTNHKPKYNIPAVTDFSTPGAHISTNIPMCAKGDEDNKFSFNHIACPYRISFSDLDVSKVRLTVTHSLTHNLSGDYTVENSDGGLWAQYAGAGSANQSVSFIKNVSEGSAVFYFSLYKYGQDSFQPTITLYDESTGYILYRKTAKDNWCSVDKLKPNSSRMVLLPAIPASGTGVPFISAYGVNWSSATNIAGSTAEGKDAIKCLKYTSTSSNIYLYAEIKDSKIYNDASYQYGNHWYLYLGNGTGDVKSLWNQDANSQFEGWVKKDNVYEFSHWKSAGTSVSGIAKSYISVDGITYLELSIPRSSASYLQGTSCQIGMYISSAYVNGTGAWLGSDSTIVGVAPVDGGDIATATLVSYVAP